MIKAVIIIVLVFGSLAFLVYLGKKSERLKLEAQKAEDERRKQEEITKIYERKQNEANEIKRKEAKEAEGTIDAGNSIVDSFNGMQHDKEK